MVVAILAGLVNKQLVASIEALGGRAVGLTGIDGAPFEGSKLSKRTEPMVKVRELAYAVMEAVLERPL